jgi:hypothetical protein
LSPFLLPTSPISPRRDVVARLLAAVPPGSFVVISRAGRDRSPGAIAALEETLDRHLPGERHTARPRGDVKSLFAGTRLLSPGVVPVSQWRPGTADEAAVPATLWGGIGGR